jgi:RimJ/RimL family protein N-acetyltransferase
MAPPILTARLALRAFVPEDAAEVHAEVLSDPEVMRLVGGPVALDEVRVLLERAIVSLEQHGLGMLAVVERETGLIAGEAGLVPFDDRGPEVELAYTLARRAWGRGYATEAGRALLAEAFGALGLDRVVAVTRPENAASQRVLARLGFAATGRVHAWGAEQLRYERLPDGA